MTTLFDKLLLVAKGFCMGAADVVPGVSGGTMALILGIYRQLIEAVKSFDLQWFIAIVRFEIGTVFKRPHFPFLIPLGIGIVGAVLFFTRVISIPKMLETDPELIYGLFFGLIVGSIIVLALERRPNRMFDYVTFVAGAVAGFFIVTSVPSTTPDDWWFIMFSGAIAICAMVLPGISGSFILLILGKYAYILDGIGHFNFSIILPFAIGAGLGLMMFTRLLSWLLGRFERATMFVIIGFLCASLWVIWPFQQREYVIVRDKPRILSSLPVWPDDPTNLLPAFALALVGAVLVVLLRRIALDRQQAR